MDFETGRAEPGGYALYGVRHFDLEATLDCGQCFRWEKKDEGAYEGTAFGLRRAVTQQGDRVFFHRVGEEEFYRVWWDYFDFGRDYGALKALFATDPVLCRAVDYAPGIRVLRQEGWETLCSFILSQNNNIKRIKGLVDRLCSQFGAPIPGGRGFPAPRRLAALSPEELAPVRSGFRAKYIIDAARAVEEGRVELEVLPHLPLEEARAMLRTIHGVGPKVAECALLYGFGRAECVPVDVWMSRVLTRWYPAGLPEAIRPVAGLAQQYLFHYARMEGVTEETLFS